MTITPLVLTALLSFALGWSGRGALSKIIDRLAVKLLVSHFGQEVVLETLADGMAKLAAQKGGAA